MLNSGLIQLPQTLEAWILRNGVSFNAPVIDVNKKYTCVECGCEGRGWEAFRIFMETQLKRLIRPFAFLLTFGQSNFFSYFAHGETSMKQRLKSIWQDERNVYDEIYAREHDRQTQDNSIQNIGHATQLLRMNGMTILTDPTFGNLNWLLYPSKTRAGLTVKELPEIDLILISHNHRDHVDESSLKALLKRNPNMRVFVPHGDEELFINLGFKPENVLPTEWYSCIEMTKDENNKTTKVYLPKIWLEKLKKQVQERLEKKARGWFRREINASEIAEDVNKRLQSYVANDAAPAPLLNASQDIEENNSIQKFKITAVASKHWSGRGLTDKCKSATNGWIASDKDRVVYFAGDTAMMEDDTHLQIVEKTIRYLLQHNEEQETAALAGIKTAYGIENVNSISEISQAIYEKINGIKQGDPNIQWNNPKDVIDAMAISYNNQDDIKAKLTTLSENQHNEISKVVINQPIKEISAKLYENLPDGFFENDNKKIYLQLPDGPNYTRDHMKGTHMSIIDGVIMRMNIAKTLANISKHTNKQPEHQKISFWLDRCESVIMHHNKYELGPDRFNEGVYVLETMLSEFKKLNQSSIESAKTELTRLMNAEKSKWSIFLRKKNDFIYEGMIKLIDHAEAILKENTPGTEPTMENIVSFIETEVQRIKFPKIGEGLDFGDAQKTTSYKALIATNSSSNSQGVN